MIARASMNHMSVWKGRSGDTCIFLEAGVLMVPCPFPWQRAGDVDQRRVWTILPRHRKS
jgi:hypothetical protein